jgi:hypothetical protein
MLTWGRRALVRGLTVGDTLVPIPRRPTRLVAHFPTRGCTGSRKNCHIQSYRRPGP